MFAFSFAELRVDDPVTGDRINGHNWLRQTKEKLASTRGSSAIEAEREFIQIVVQVLVTDGRLVGAHQPTFEQRDHSMNSWHQVGGSLLFASGKCDLVLVAFALQGQISQPSV